MGTGRCWRRDVATSDRVLRRRAGGQAVGVEPARPGEKGMNGCRAERMFVRSFGRGAGPCRLVSSRLGAVVRRNRRI